MAYKRSATPSEGEYTSDSEKAHKTSHTRNGTNVDRRIRDYISKSRSRSRSPFRASRAEKRSHRDRSRDRDRYDSRQFRVKYEDGYNDRRGHRKGDSYEDLDPGRSSRSHLRYEDEDDRRSRHKRQRTRSRSRSPFRRDRRKDNPRHVTKDDRYYRENRPRDSGRGTRDSVDSRSLREQSVSERGYTPSVAQNSRTHAETQVPQTASSTTKTDSVLDAAGNTVQPGQTDTSLSLEPKDEAAIIEERRKRREAIRAKYRSQPTPLLVQALEQKGSESMSAATTPATSKAMTPESDSRPMSPQTPNVSDPQSPADFDFSKEENLANREKHGSVGADEGPSAADYDPTVDMREERARHEQSLFHEDKQSLTNDTAQFNGTKDIEAQQPTKTKDEFDMFADDDEMDEDDDMFAPASSNKASANGESKGRAQALDVNMMDNWDDPEGYYITIRDELFADRYVVMHTLGRGMFSSVIRAKDTQTGQLVAIKITRNNDTMRKAGFKEISILETLGAADPTDTKHMIRLLTSFEHKGHLCLVFENLSLNLRELLKKFGRDVGLNIKAIRSYAQQLFLGLSLLKKCGIIHADLKPDNVLCSDNHAHIKICDLGSAAPVTDNEIAPYLVSRFYRAPEIMLGIDYDTGIDIWSIGCTLFELYTGKILFTGRNNNGMLKAIMESRGPFPNKLLRRGRMTFDHFDDMLTFYSREEDKLSGRVFTKQMTFKKPTRDLRSRVIPKGKKMVDEGERKDVELFLDLLDKCLDLRPEKRITPNDALRHPFIMRGTVPVGEKGR